MPHTDIKHDNSFTRYLPLSCAPPMNLLSNDDMNTQSSFQTSILQLRKLHFSENFGAFLLAHKTYSPLTDQHMFEALALHQLNGCEATIKFSCFLRTFNISHKLQRTDRDDRT